MYLGEPAAHLVPVTRPLDSNVEIPKSEILMCHDASIRTNKISK